MRCEAGSLTWRTTPAEIDCKAGKAGAVTGTAASAARSYQSGHAPVAEVEGRVLARIFIISNRVAIPNPGRGIHAGGLEVALRATLKRHSCVWLGWSGAVKPANEIETCTITHRDNAASTAEIPKGS